MQGAQGFEWAGPKISWSYGRFQGFASFNPLGLSHGDTPVKVEGKLSGNSKDELKYAATVEVVLSKYFSTKFGADVGKLIEKAVPYLTKEVSKANAKGFVKALGESAKAELKVTPHEFHPAAGVKLAPEVSFDIAALKELPLTLKAKGQWNIPFDQRTAPALAGFEIPLKGEVGAHIGLSEEAWRKVTKDVAREVVKRFFGMGMDTLRGGYEAFVAAGGIEVAGSSLLLLAWVGAGLYSIKRGQQTGRIQALVTWCGKAYISKVWGMTGDGPGTHVLPADRKLAEALFEYGANLAMDHAREMYKLKGSFQLTDAACLEFYREYLEQYYGGTWKAQHWVREKVESETRKALENG